MSDESKLVDEIVDAEPINVRPLEELLQNESKKDSEEIETDNSGESTDEKFDPNIHRVDSAGNPIYTVNGKYAKKRGRKPGQAKTNTINSEPIDDSGITQANQLGIVTAETIFSVCQGIMGEEWTPIVDPKTGLDERNNMRVAWSQYYLATGKRDLPPSMIVMVAMTIYAAPRFRYENTRSRFGKIGIGIFNAMKWVKSKLFKTRERKEGE